MEKEVTKSVSQEQIHDLLFGRELGWQEIIYDLINTEQLDPWDLNLTILTDKYLEKIYEIEEADFFVSSKVLLAASLLIRIKSEILLNKYIKSVDEILFGKEDKKVYALERIELEEEIPELVPRSPMPRFRKVTLKELIESLNKAIVTENRRIRKEIVHKNALRETGFSMPKKKFSIKNKIREFYQNLTIYFKEDKTRKRISFTKFVGKNKDERIIAFSPLLHLESQKKIWLEQETHFEEIHIWLKETFLKHNPDPFLELREQVQEELKNLGKEEKDRLKDVDEKFVNPIGE